MSNIINFGKMVTIKQAGEIILATPDNINHLEGEPGSGKSSILDFLAERLPNHIIADPIDVPTLDLGDTAMPVVDRDRMLTNYAPNSRFKLTMGQPVVLMLDEYPKGADPIKNMLHGLFEAKRRRLGDVYLYPGSYVFTTGNRSSDGVGDNLKAHTRGRLTTLPVSKPDADQWLEWAVENNIDPVVMAWVKQFPHCLDSYLNGDDTNPYFFNPKKVQIAYVSPRSLYRASNIVRARADLDQDSVIAALSGTIGEAAARDMQAYIAYQDQLPTWESIMRSPMTATVPDSAGACAVMVFGAIAKLDKNNIAPFMDYVERMEPEWQAAFCINAAKSKTKQAVAFSSKKFADWVRNNEDML